MSEARSMVRDLIDRLLRDGCDRAVREGAGRGIWPASLWSRIDEAELATLAVPQALGGAGLSLADAMVVAHEAGRHAAPVPLVECVIGNWLLALAGQAPLRGAVTVPAGVDAGLRLSRSGAFDWRLSGTASCVPWAEEASHLVVVARRDDTGDDVILSLARGEFGMRKGRSVAYEPRASVIFEDASIPGEAIEAGTSPGAATALLLAGALARCHQMAGSMAWCVEQTLAYANERAQFGKAIGGFQAVQHLLAVMVSHSCAAQVACDAADNAIGSGDFEEAVAIAKARVGEAAAEVAAVAHQVHGAMGYCEEFALHHRTRRLWSWRDEFGGERDWQIRLGRKIAARGADALWPALTDMV